MDDDHDGKKGFSLESLKVITDWLPWDRNGTLLNSRDRQGLIIKETEKKTTKESFI